MGMWDQVGWLPPQPPSFATLLDWYPTPLPLLPVTAILAAALYIAGVLRLHTLRRRWPWIRTVCFLAGCLTLAAVTGLAIEGYGLKLFSAFMFQHLTLSILVPPLLVLGAPGTLLLRATPHRGLGRVILLVALAGLRSRLARIVLHPGFTIPVFLLGYYGLYLSDLFDAAASTWIGHLGLEIFFLASGILFIVPILSVDPLPVRQSNLGRFLDIFVEMPLHVFIGVILMMAPRALTQTFASPPAGWNVDPVSDQAIAGALAWSYGEPIAVATVLVFAVRWRRDEERSAARRDVDDGEHDEQLAAYNAFLQRLQPPARGTAPPEEP